MDKNLIRKEVWIWENKIEALQKEADRRGWALKKYMEFILVRESEKLQKKNSN